MKTPLFLFLALLWSILTFGADPRIVAIGDIHGDVTSFKTILQTAGIINGSGNWSGGKAILVQTGDALDRGTQSKQVIDLLMRLQHQARKVGGRVYVLLGNHEVMNLMSDLRYVPAEEYAHYANQRTNKRLKDAYEMFKKFETKKAERRKQPPPQFTEQSEAEWFKNHPPGFLEHIDAFGPAGEYGKWLRNQEAVLELHQNVFVHGGISQKIATMSISQINDRIRQEIELFDELKKRLVEQEVILPFHTFNEMIDEVQKELAIKQNDETLQAFARLGGWLSIYPEGPLWFRGYAQWTDEEIALFLPPLLKTYGARRFIVGHTVVKNAQIQSRLQNSAIIIDTGMNRKYYPEGRASALVIEGQKLTALYSDQEISLAP